MFIIPHPGPIEPGRTPPKPLPEGSFAAVSLGQWMALAEEAGVAAVPACLAGRLNIEDVLRYDEPGREPTRIALAELNKINQDTKPGEMLRWDCCAGIGLKYGMSEGAIPHGDDLHLAPDDPRAFDILFQYPSDEIDVWRRPWIQADTLDGFPIEFRVFVARGEVIGLANYYLQRDLPAEPRILETARQAVEKSQAMLDVMELLQKVPAMPGMSQEFLDGAGTHCSLDFLLTPQGELLFLEGGPGFGFGAHPCAFLQENERDVDPIEGLKLGVGKPAMSLDDLFERPAEAD